MQIQVIRKAETKTIVRTCLTHRNLTASLSYSSRHAITSLFSGKIMQQAIIMSYSRPLKCLFRQNISKWAPSQRRLILLLLFHCAIQMALIATKKVALPSSRILAKERLIVIMRIMETKLSKAGFRSACLMFLTLNTNSKNLHLT